MTYAGNADLTKLAADLTAAGQSVRVTAQKLVSNTATSVKSIAVSTAPKRSGKLAGSIMIAMSGPLTAEIGPQVPYAGFIEYGTKAHVIRPRTPGGTLAFGGRYAKSVNHPGTKANPFMRKALMEALEPFTGELLDSGALAITRGKQVGL